MRILFFFLLLAPLAHAESLPCQTNFSPEACADGTGLREEAQNAARLFRKTCRATEERFTGLPKLKSQCAKPSKGTELTACTEKWNDLSRAFVTLHTRANTEKKNLEKVFLTLLTPYSCEAAEKNKEILRDLTRRYDVVMASLKPVREEAKAEVALFRDAFVKTLVPMKFSDGDKQFLGIVPEEPRAPPKADEISKMGWVDRVTAYRIALEVNYPGPKDITIEVGGIPVKTSAVFAKVLRLEGSGILDDGRLVNSAGGKFIFVPVIKAPYGLGSYKRTPLEPFRSIAVDPKEIPLGSTVFIYEARGMPLAPGPDGKPRYHDGYFRAIDVGGSILGTHIDVYSGHDVEDYRFVQKFFYNKTVHYFIVRP